MPKDVQENTRPLTRRLEKIVHIEKSLQAHFGHRASLSWIHIPDSMENIYWEITRKQRIFWDEIQRRNPFTRPKDYAPSQNLARYF